MHARRLIAHSVLALLALAPAALAQGVVWTVGPSGSADFDTIQPAVHAAADGDFVLVEAGAYPSFVVDDKELTIVASSTASVSCGTIRVRNLSLGKRCVFRGLSAQGQSETSIGSTGAWLIDCAGTVWFEDARLEARHGLDHGGPALAVDHCAQVVIVRSFLLGGSGESFCGNGIDAASSRLALFDTEVHGGVLPYAEFGIEGGHGVVLSDSSFLFASGGRIRGGDGAETEFHCGGNGGDGLVVQGNSSAELSEAPVSGGYGGWQNGICLPCCDGSHGSAFVGGPIVQHGVAPRRLETPAFLRASQQATLRFLGEPGDRAFLLWSHDADFVQLPSWSGVLTLYKPAVPGSWRVKLLEDTAPFHFGSSFLGVVPAGGLIEIPLTALDPAGEGEGLYVQAFVVDALGATALGSPSRLVALDAQAPVDCNWNGIPDSDDIANGTSADCDGNQVPDECELFFPDCNGNGIDDECELANGSSNDCNADSVPDECGPDCDLDGVPDQCEILFDAGLDCDEDGVLDACEAFDDCNQNGVLDACEISSGSSADSNGSGVPDECETRLYVDASAAAGGDGLSWATAHHDLNAALAVAALGPDVVLEIWVAAGTYRPGPPGQLNARFRLAPGVDVYGGFAGGETSLFERDARANPTILSGDLDQDGTSAGNASQIVVYHEPEGAVRLDGFTFRDAYAIPGTSGDSGGAIWAYWPDGTSRLEVVDCVFVNNTAGGGGAIACLRVELTLVNCAFFGNRAPSGYGGAISGSESPLEVVNCLFVGNVASSTGGVEWSRSDVHVVGSTFAFNAGTSDSQWKSGGLYYRHSLPTHGNRLRVEDCVFWGNTIQGVVSELAQIRVYSGDAEVSYSCIHELDEFSGSGNHGLDPLFVDAAGLDGLLGTLDDDLRLQLTSPCIDAGRNAFLPADLADLDRDGDFDERLPLDLDLAPRQVDVPSVPDTGSGQPPLVDMGAYERGAP